MAQFNNDHYGSGLETELLQMKPKMEENGSGDLIKLWKKIDIFQELKTKQVKIILGIAMCKKKDTEGNPLCLWTIGLLHWSPEQIHWARRQ